MATSTTSRFALSSSFDIASFSAQHKKICIVCMVGKSRYGHFNSKASMLNDVIGRTVFQGIDRDIGDYIDKGHVKFYFDEANQVLYIHALSLLDTPVLVEQCHQKSTAEKAFNKNFHSVLHEDNYQLAKMMLLLFSLSHIILLVSPGCTFDLSFVRLFRLVNTIRLKVQEDLSDLLAALPVSSEWRQASRLCPPPRVLFVFQTCPLRLSAEDGSASGKVHPGKMSSLRRLQHILEDQIYRILRRFRIISNVSNSSSHSLFVVPANQSFVFVSNFKHDIDDPITFLLHSLKSNYSDTASCETLKGGGGVVNGDVIASREPLPIVGLPTRQEHTFKNFLWQHVECVLGRGFRDVAGPNSASCRFELPEASTWLQAYEAMLEFLFSTDIERQPKSALQSMRTLSDPSLKFSESHCGKVKDVAESVYLEDLPVLYVTSVHLSKLEEAVQVYHHYVRGPAIEDGLSQLKESCTLFWMNGHRQCEAISLSGNLCVNPLHRDLSDSTVDKKSRDLPVMPHCSRLKTMAACNCGRLQAEKDDPFDHRGANYDFYLTLEAACCGTLDHIDLPVYRLGNALSAALPADRRLVADSGQDADVDSSVSESKSRGGSEGSAPGLSAHSLAASPASISERCECDTAVEADLAGSVHSDGSQGLTEGGSGAQSNGDLTGVGREGFDDVDDFSLKSCACDDDDEDADAVDGVETEPCAGNTQADGDAVHTHSQLAVEYLQGMFHSGSPTALLPKFPSWNLCCMDDARSFNHQIGLDLPGFLPGTNFLLPWDLPVADSEQCSQWPAVLETSLLRSHGRRFGKKRFAESGDGSGRAHVGLEYECPLGHRFFCSAPDKVIKVMGNCPVKDTASRMVSTDMPLYTPCYAHGKKSVHAQVMRAYVVTPAHSARVRLCPRVRPVASPCPIFSPGIDGVELPAGGVWVLRFPHVYVGDDGPINVPSHGHNLSSCVVLKGLFTCGGASDDA